MKLSDFDYVLPKELIAQFPQEERDLCRLMVLNRKDKTIEHRIFKDIKEYVRKEDSLILNNSKVLPARLFGVRHTGGKVEILLLKRITGVTSLEKNSFTGVTPATESPVSKDSDERSFTFNALMRPGRVKLNEKITFNNGKFYGELTAKDEITFYAKDLKDVYSHGVMPLPPYIKRHSQDLDTAYYQTIYASIEGSVAAPTAGLHFTAELIKEMESCGIRIAYVTLHVGYPTFKPVKNEDITHHTMEPEYFSIPEETATRIDNAHTCAGRIFAVGTTTARVLETYASSGSKEGDTNLFIYPGYTFRGVDCLLTNFHLPRTTLFMLVCAFCATDAYLCDGDGIEFVKRAYQEAIDKKYRFYSYGDAMLII